ncbi:Aste57867_21884 [Aphanomyces stellatus]|uniref:Aste57867_21884 protein n=1 Tax=Aphanomyces stellatus TaxID=120398 RepID=A0A485LIQ9_9STRA|nr:hypothetical protein As57867_021815 [Aphanomyces stellatus]VFT98552.1 Aste57867_21884 [Aphanomyces stellatus]
MSSDEDEITYDIHADGNSKLTKSLQNARALSDSTQAADRPTVDGAFTQATLQASNTTRRHTIVSSYLDQNNSDDDDEDGFASILQFEPPKPPAAVEQMDKPLEQVDDPQRGQGNSRPRHSSVDLSQGFPRSQSAAASILCGIASTSTVHGPSQHRLRRVQAKRTPQKATSESFEAAFDRPSHWLRAAPTQSMPQRARPAKRPLAAVILARNSPQPQSTPLRKSMADVLREATIGSSERPRVRHLHVNPTRMKTLKMQAQGQQRLK